MLSPGRAGKCQSNYHHWFSFLLLRCVSACLLMAYLVSLSSLKTLLLISCMPPALTPVAALPPQPAWVVKQGWVLWFLMSMMMGSLSQEQFSHCYYAEARLTDHLAAAPYWTGNRNTLASQLYLRSPGYNEFNLSKWLPFVIQCRKTDCLWNAFVHLLKTSYNPGSVLDIAGME